MHRPELGPALRELRMTAGLEAKAVARGAVMSRSKLSKIENGHAVPSVTDVDRILTALGVSAEVKAEYMAAAREAATEVTAWRLVRRLGYSRKQQQIQALEASTHLLRLFQPSVIPGLLQTPEYVRAIFSGKEVSPEERDRTVVARLARQRVLRSEEKRFRFLVTESVLRWRLVPPPMMVGQLDHLVSISRLPRVDIGIVPSASRQTDSPGHSFVLRDDRTVTVETEHAELVVTDPRDIALYARKFERFAEVAVHGDEMRDLVADIRDEFLRELEIGEGAQAPGAIMISHHSDRPRS